MKHTYDVTGMHCGGCVANVRQVVSDVAGVRDVAVDLPGGTVVVDHDDTVGDEQIRAAIVEAGYQPA